MFTYKGYKATQDKKTKMWTVLDAYGRTALMAFGTKREILRLIDAHARELAQEEAV